MHLARDDAVDKPVRGLEIGERLAVLGAQTPLFVGIRSYLGPADIKDLDIYYQDCVVGGPDSFMIPIHDTSAFVEATRNKLVREIADRPAAKPKVQLAADSEPRISCMIGENLWRGRWGN